MQDNPIARHKQNLINQAIERYKIKSIIDVGACWGVNGGYTFHALENGVERATILDGFITPLTKKRAVKFPNLVLNEIDLGDREKIALLPEHDACILFDVLLHQVNPNWDEFIQLYARKVKFLIIYNQDYIGDETIRFIDKGKDWYFQQKFAQSYTKEKIEQWFENHESIHETQNKPLRDIHNYWQWGIIPIDIMRVAIEEGSSLIFLTILENYHSQILLIAMLICLVKYYSSLCKLNSRRYSEFLANF